MTFKYGIDHLDLDIVNGIANGSIKAELCQEALNNINISRQRVEKMAASVLAHYATLKSHRLKPTYCKQIY